MFITRHNLHLNPKPPKDILIIGIDASSINKVGIPWPWPRQFHASLLDGLVKNKARFVFFDIIFDTISPLSLQTQDIKGENIVSESSFDEGKEDDAIFAKSIKNAMNVFFACEAEPLSGNKYEPALPIPPFINALNNDPSFLGNTSITYDNDNYVRHARITFPEYYPNKALISSVSLRIAQKLLETQGEVLKDYSVLLKEKRIPKKFLINFYGTSETIKTIPYWKALELIYSGGSNIFKDKIVLIGRSKLKASIDPYKSVRAPDTFPTPFLALTPNFSGIELQATMLGNILEHSFITEVSNSLSVLLIIFIGILTSIIVFYLRSKLVYCFYICLSFSVFYLFTAFLLFLFCRISIPVTYPIFGAIFPIYFINFLDQYFFVDSARRRQAKIFRQLVPSQIADEIEKMDQDELALGGTRRTITVLFADIKNFTGICEKETPEIVVNILNKFFTQMVNVIHEKNGLVDKFIGDAIMALWGSPKVIDNKTQANFSAECALSMKNKLKLLNEFLKRTGYKNELNIRIGINTDEVITGNVGSPERMQFSAIGDGVNIAARLESVNKVYNTDILLSENSRKYLDKSFKIREIDTVLVPGKDTPINIFELLENSINSDELINFYTLGLKAYREKLFDEAINCWKKCLQLNPNDAPSKVMLERTIKLKNSELPTEWKAIFVVENK